MMKISSEPTLIEHWDRTAWNIIPSPNSTFKYNQLKSVVAVEAKSKSMTLSGITDASENDIWAVGVYSNTSSGTSGGGPALIEHWNGKQWSIISNPNIAVLGGLLGVTQVPKTNKLIAVGTDGSQTLTVFSC